MKKEYWFWSLKLCAAIFNGAATYAVFYSIFSAGERGVFFSVLSAILSVVLIDLFFIAALITLEDKTVPIRERLVWSVSATLLAIATLTIGVADEGILGLVPRVGFALLVVQDVLAVLSDWSEVHNSRNAIEQRIRDEQVIMRREQKKRAYKTMITSPEIQEAFIAKLRSEELKNLEIKESTPVSEPIPSESYVEEVEPNIVQFASGGCGWVDGKGELHTTTALGKPYSYQGAKAAESRARKNGKH